MAKRSRANIILITSLFIVTVLLIVAVTFLVITLGKNSDTTTCATPPAQPCDQKTVLPYYFSVESSSISYEDVKNDYSGSARKLQDQITQALTSAQSSERSADQSALDANSNILPVAVLGISNGTGGVLVIASAVFTGASLPNSQSITKALNTSGLETIMIANGTYPINSNINTQMCQQVNPVPPGASTTNTPTTLPPKTTPSPVTTSTQPTKQPPPPPTTTCPVCYCPTPTIMRTTTTSPTPCPPPTIHPPFPCQRNIIILFDSSNGMNANQYLNQTAFISHQLFTSSWTFDETNVALAAYDNTDPFHFEVTSPFSSINTLEEAQDGLRISQYNNTASVMTALKMTADPATFPSATPCVQQSTVLFTSTSVQTDILGAVQYAHQIRRNGPLIIVAMGPNASVDKLNYLTSSDEIFAWPDYNNVPADLASNITQALCSPSSTATPVLSTGTSPAILSSVSVSTTTSSSISLPTTSACTGPPPTTTPPIPCQTNVVFLIDGSNGVTDAQFKNQTSFIASIFQTNWTYNEISIAIGEYSDLSYFYLFAPFGDVTDYNSAQIVFKEGVSYNGGNANLTAVMQKMDEPSTFSGSTACVQKAVVLFTSTSVQTDIQGAVQYAHQIRRNGPLIIVAMGSNASVDELSYLTSSDEIFAWPDYSHVPADLASNITQAMCSPSSTATPIMPTGASSAITSSAPVITATSPTFTPPTAGLTSAITKTMVQSTVTSSSSTLDLVTTAATAPPTTAACTGPPPTATPPIPCQTNVIFLIDGSDGVTDDQFKNQTNFIASIFQTKWTYNEIGIAIGEYSDPSDFYSFASFGDIKKWEDVQATLKNDVEHIGGSANLKAALQKTEDPTTFTGGIGCVQKAVVLFTSTSVQTDILGAVQYAHQIRRNGPLIIVAMGPNASVDELNYLTSKDDIYEWPDYNNVPADLASNIIQAMCSSSSTATPVLPTVTLPAMTSPAPTTMPSSSAPVTSASLSSTFAPTTAACTGPPPTTTPPMPCQTNVIFLIDGSDGITGDQFKKQTSFIESIFHTDWTYNEISIAIGEYFDPSTIFPVASFGDIKKWEDVQDVLKNNAEHFGGVANLTAALQETEDPKTFTGGMGCVQKAVVLFTSTSADADVATAQQYADGIKKNGPLIIVAMGPNASVSKLSSLASPTPVIQWLDYNNVPADLATNITRAMCSAS